MRIDPAQPAPKISIVLATCRRGGFDVIKRTLLDQKERDFELVLVDYFWEQRRDLFAREWAQAGLEPGRLVHAPPRRRQSFPDASMAYNTGIALARGRLVCFLGDNIYGPPTWLSDHWAVAEATGWQAFLCGPFQLYQAPPLASGPIDDLSLFYRDFEPTDLVVQVKASYKPPDGLTPWSWGPRTIWPLAGARAGQHYHATKNESVGLAALYEINGFDEAFDGHRGYGDLDVGVRLHKAGHSPVCFTGAVITRGIDYSSFPPEVALPGHALPIDGQAQKLLHASMGDSAPSRAENGGFNVADPLTIEAVVEGWRA